MGHKSHDYHNQKKREASNPPNENFGSTTAKKKNIEIVLKGDTAGSLEAVAASIMRSVFSGVGVEIIETGVGDISKSDVFMAETASRLIIGFDVDVIAGVDRLLREKAVEVRLYKVIYKLIEDLKKITGSFSHEEAVDEIVGTAKVIALFKSSRKGIILGCAVEEGSLSLGRNFRVISAMGPVYQGKIESLHIEKNAINRATIGQQVGLKISNFNKVKIDDIIECYHSKSQKPQATWKPKGKILYL